MLWVEYRTGRSRDVGILTTGQARLELYSPQLYIYKLYVVCNFVCCGCAACAERPTSDSWPSLKHEARSAGLAFARPRGSTATRGLRSQTRATAFRSTAASPLCYVPCPMPDTDCVACSGRLEDHCHIERSQGGSIFPYARASAVRASEVGGATSSLGATLNTRGLTCVSARTNRISDIFASAWAAARTSAIAADIIALRIASVTAVAAVATVASTISAAAVTAIAVVAVAAVAAVAGACCGGAT